MKLKKIIADCTYSSLKILFCIICYVVTLLFAICSGYFTIIFYAKGQTGNNQLIIGLLAGLFEFIKFTFAIAHPFMEYRKLEIEKRVKQILVVALFMSILSSLYFFMDGGNIDRSPASRITSLIYSYVPILNVFPLKFIQFITTMSLSIIIEVLIIKIPSIAPVFYYKKNFARKKVAVTNWDKLRDVIVSIPNRFIDQLYEKYFYEPGSKKILNSANEESSVIEECPETDKYLDFKEPLLISDTSSNDELTKAEEDGLEMSSLGTEDDNESEISGQSKDEDVLKFLKLMYENSKDNISISQAQMSKLTGFSDNKIKSLRKLLRGLGILQTNNFKTHILVDYETAIRKVKEGNYIEEAI